MPPDAAWVALSLQPRVGYRMLRALSEHFDGDLHVVPHADAATLQSVPGIGPKIAAALQQTDIPAVERALQRWQAQGVRVLTRDDPAYPAPLMRLQDEPATLFVRGALPDIWPSAVSIVGTRQPTWQGVDLAQRMAASSVRAGHLVISGLALGIDGIAHQSALDHAGVTVAVLGSGVLKVYPPEHHGLAERILKRGALLSEVAPDVQTNAQRLVARNRLITGLSVACVVVETAVHGGAMHAARFAQRQGVALRTFDLPASGNQQLIRDGAQVLPQG